MASNPSQRLDPAGSPAKSGNGRPSARPERIPSSTGTGHDIVRTILRMRAVEGRERAFEHDLREAMDEISHEPGILRQDLMRDADDPRTFLIISDWTDRTTLEEFGRSDRRDRIMAPVREIRESAERHTYEALQSVARRGPGIRVMVTVTVGEGEEEAFERAYLKVAERVRMTPGHVQEELLREPGTRTFHIFAEWEDERSFHAWADNPAHLEQTGPLVPYLMAGDFKRTIYHVRGPGARPEAREHEPELAGEKAPRPQPAPHQPPSASRQPPSAPRDDAEPGAGIPAIIGGPARPAADVLIVGAGPTGLTAAIELARRGIACRVIDKRAEPSAQADKAIGIQCRTMEMWEDIGIAREAMDAGIWLNGQTVFVNGRKTHQIDWNFPELPYGHLGLPQYETERLLASCLAGHGVSIERGVELCGLTQDAAGVTAHVRRDSQDTGAIRASYVVGCDGAQSAVRELLGLTFEGGMAMFPQLFMLGDVDIEWSVPEGHLLRFVRLADNELRGMLVCVPLRGHRRYRVATLAPRRLQEEIGSGPVPPGFSREYAPPALTDIQAAIDELAPAGTKASNLRWSSIFRIKHGIVDRYRAGRVFVAGDAAHLHPPAGGQGMNTGIQDAWNLGWKLALAVRGEAAPSLLDSYEAERRPAGKEIVDRAVRIAFTDEIDMDDERRQFLTDMQMTLSYAESPLVGEAMSLPGAPGAAPAPGERAPDAHGLRRTGVGHPLRVFDLTRGTSHTLLLYADASVAEEDVLRFEALAGSLRELCADQLNAYVLLSPEAPMPAGLGLPVLRDADDQFRAVYGVTGASAYLIRPDGHVGFRSSPVAATALRKHLEGVFTTRSSMADSCRAEGNLKR
jgi:2-polyprenyl-6-methoxyphenol hydroxylase-like FAD-dependent oxidoreductase/quinol monooxygenase YgiN